MKLLNVGRVRSHMTLPLLIVGPSFFFLCCFAYTSLLLLFSSNVSILLKLSILSGLTPCCPI